MIKQSKISNFVNSEFLLFTPHKKFIKISGKKRFDNKTENSSIFQFYFKEAQTTHTMSLLSV